MGKVDGKAAGYASEAAIDCREQPTMPLSVYKFEVIEGQEWIFPADEDDYESFFAMDGRVIQDWIALS